MQKSLLTLDTGFMSYLYQPYTILLIAAAGLATAQLLIVLRYRPTLGTRSFAVLMGAVAMWAFVTLFEVIAQDLPTKSFAGNFKYLFIVIVPVAFFIFALNYSNRLRRLRRSQLIMLSTVPLVTLAMVATNEHHHLMFESVQLRHGKDLWLLSRTFGPWFWVHTAYSYGLLLLGFVFLAKSLIDSPRLYRGQVISLIIAGLTPWVCNALFLVGANPLPHLDLTPFAFSISGLAVMWGLVRYRLLDVVPIARDVVIQNMRDGLFVLDNDLRILDLNASAGNIMCRQPADVIGRRAEQVIDWWPPASSKTRPDAIGLPAMIEVTRDKVCRRMQVTESVLHHKERPLGHLVLLRDITEESRLQEQLLQSRKMVAIGTLAGGIAHDFNNLLMGMQANISLLRLETDPTGYSREKHKRIEDQIQSGAALTRQLLGYARKGRYGVATIDMHHLVRDTLHVIQRTNKHIVVRRALSATTALLDADRGQMELVLLNLFVNAVDAMPKGGELEVATRMVQHLELADQWIDLKPGRYLEITVSDTGVGMDQATIKRIFEPFFTTKEIGRGTGLGLASVYGAVKNHNGHIRVTSSVDQGTTVTLLFPASEKSVPTPCDSLPPVLPGPPNGKQVLVVDDEAIILKLIGEMVQSLGFTPCMARDGREAVRIYVERNAMIDLVILDMVMPHMDGRDVFEALRTVNPDVKVIIASGHGPNERSEEILGLGPHLLLKKPFTRNALSRAMATLLGASSGTCRPATTPTVDRPGIPH